MSTTSAPVAEKVEAANATPAADLSRYRAPANPHARLVAQRLAALMACVKDQDIVDIARVLFHMAKDGDRQAAKLLFSYVLGKPAAAVPPDRLDVDEWQIFKDTAPMAAEMPHLAQTPLSSFPRDIVRMMRPANAADLAKQIRQYVHQPAAAAEGAPEGQGGPSPNGKNPSTSPSPNGDSRRPSALDPEAWFVDLNIASPPPNGASSPRRRDG